MYVPSQHIYELNSAQGENYKTATKSGQVRYQKIYLTTSDIPVQSECIEHHGR